MIELLWQGVRGLVLGIAGLLADIWSYIADNFKPVQDSLDLLLVAVAVYWLLMLIRGTRAFQIVLGLMLLVAASLAAHVFELLTLSWILEKFLASAVLIIVVLFQQDLRRALARVGRGLFPTVSQREASQMLEEIVRAMQVLARRRTGALVVLERETPLDDLIEAGPALDAVVTKELLISIFHTASPLHDGAVWIQGGRIAHAGCILPLTLRADLPEGVGTRHRAAVGITEEADALAVLVSEETGQISLVEGGELRTGLDSAELRVLLRERMAGGRVEADSAQEAPAEASIEAPAAAEPERGTAAASPGGSRA